MPTIECPSSILRMMLSVKGVRFLFWDKLVDLLVNRNPTICYNTVCEPKKVRENRTTISKVRDCCHIAQKEVGKFYTFRCSEVCTKGINRVILQVREMGTFLVVVRQTRS